MSTPNPSSLLWIVQIGTMREASAVTCDPALDLEGDVLPIEGEEKTPALVELLTEYERTRDPKLAARLPVVPGKQLVRLAVGPLTSAVYRWANDALGVNRAQRAFLCCCHTFVDENGVEHVAAKFGAFKEPARGVRIASDGWLDHVQETLGAQVIEEVAQVALDRAKAGPRAVSPFCLPHGLILPI